MVLESIINAVKAEKKPWDLVLLGMVYTAIAILLALWVFKEQTSMVMVLLTVMAVTPLMINIIKLEEQKQIYLDSESTILKEHAKAVIAYASLFLGFTLTFTLFFLFLPNDLVSYAFNIQSSTISDITGNALIDTSVTHFSFFKSIFFNNVKVLIFCLLFSLIYGMGAIFILSWNASVLGTAVGSLIRNFVSTSAGVAGFGTVALYFKGFGLSIMRYSIHGIPEIGAYLIAGIAGGIISVAIINHDILTRKSERIVMDTSNLILAAIFILLIAAILEVWVTPYVFGLF